MRSCFSGASRIRQGRADAGSSGQPPVRRRRTWRAASVPGCGLWQHCKPRVEIRSVFQNGITSGRDSVGSHVGLGLHTVVRLVRKAAKWGRSFKRSRLGSAFQNGITETRGACFPHHSPALRRNASEPVEGSMPQSTSFSPGKSGLTSDRVAQSLAAPDAGGSSGVVAS